MTASSPSNSRSSITSVRASIEVLPTGMLTELPGL
jgi:hypothetical protein